MISKMAPMDLCTSSPWWCVVSPEAETRVYHSSGPERRYKGTSAGLSPRNKKYHHLERQSDAGNLHGLHRNSHRDSARFIISQLEHEKAKCSYVYKSIVQEPRPP
ncbi:hypothetical protein BAUCODRAFT_444965 [Baudoinia panamericana UAMH 10762]|uniref:Uncharacterized protein n=1 Tax=Baudoinia panamericana (strain UAMH 10762) TaxID=717646 RepID=M2MKM7_BAUPA|nr:uncharacterized protein BAUCODRAFT_444965 [Baudoinia panamericana UAMH 10762]EMC97246.1 hypothetical protein BAUCODRAFT_444965 [Baudoinia panamericana UAMH 10762]